MKRSWLSEEGIETLHNIFLDIAVRVILLSEESEITLTFCLEEAMKNKNSLILRKTVTTALCVALCIVLPMAFHAVQNAGKVFLPMHMPVLLCGLVCGWQYGLVCGILGPVLSSLLTQMPPVAVLPSMVAELAIYGAVTGILMYIFKNKTTYVALYTSLVTALIAGRAVSGILNALIFSAGSYSLSVWLTASFVTCLPGLLIQLVLIPTLVKALARAKALPQNRA